MVTRSLKVLIWLTCAGTALASEPLLEVRILRTGTFHGNEVDAKTGEPWFGLIATEDGYRLVRTPITVTATHDPILDEDPQTRSGKDVQVDLDMVPIALVQGGDWSEGAVPSVDFEWSLETAAAPLPLAFGDKHYEVLATWEGQGKPFGPEPLTNFRLVLKSNGRTQDLVTPEWCCDEAFPHLLWAGDLDRDGALDLLVEASHHYNVSTYVLFLSTAAREGDLVGKVAEFSTTGC